MDSETIKQLNTIIDKFKKEYGDEEKSGVMEEELFCDCGIPDMRKSWMGDEEWEATRRDSSYCPKCGSKLKWRTYEKLYGGYWRTKLNEEIDKYN